jgi:hypothetical protein
MLIMGFFILLFGFSMKFFFHRTGESKYKLLFLSSAIHAVAPLFFIG